jgi:hypothetical protein
VFLSLVSELTISSSHSAPLVTNLNDCLTDKQRSINFTNLIQITYCSLLVSPTKECLTAVSSKKVPQEQHETFICSNSVALLGTGLADTSHMKLSSECC